ncbi:hypothetical protein, partial [uncultured Lamprocystis sp.]|uniref:hypothetical protein n=1 Tax=uncultured Lamprocystis sp. TaxID=543132 RepID=UPI0025DE7E63
MSGTTTRAPKQLPALQRFRSQVGFEQPPQQGARLPDLISAQAVPAGKRQQRRAGDRLAQVIGVGQSRAPTRLDDIVIPRVHRVADIHHPI